MISIPEAFQPAIAFEEEEWNLSTDTPIEVEYDNYVKGFPAFTAGDLTFETISVFLSVNKKERTLKVLIFPWKDGESYTNHENSIPEKLKARITELTTHAQLFQELQQLANNQKSQGVIDREHEDIQKKIESLKLDVIYYERLLQGENF